MKFGIWIVMAGILLGQIGTAAESQHLDFDLETGVPGQEVFLASSLKDWDSRAFPMIEVSPGQYRIELKLPWLHELQYKFVVDGTWIMDPLNPQQVPDQLGGFNSLRILNHFQETPLLELEPGVTDPKIRNLQVEDWAGRKRELTIVEPVRLGTKTQNPVVIYFQDGPEYLENTGGGNILANLSEREDLPRLIGVFVPPVDRTEEYGLTSTTDEYVRFFTQTVVPNVERDLKLSLSASERVLVGDSLGGLISIYLAVQNPGLFRLVGSQSGAFLRANNRILDLLNAYSGPELKISLDIGEYESDRFIDGNERVKRILRDKGWDFRYEMHPAVHDWISWRNELPLIIRYLLQK